MIYVLDDLYVDDIDLSVDDIDDLSLHDLDDLGDLFVDDISILCVKHGRALKDGITPVRTQRSLLLTPYSSPY